MSRFVALLALLCTVFLFPVRSAAQQPGSIVGIVAGGEGAGVQGVLVVLGPSGAVATTDYGGAFTFADLTPGTYRLVLSVGDLEARVDDIHVQAGSPTRVAVKFPAEFTLVASATVTAVSKTPERVVDAPASVTSINESTIALEGASGQLPALLQHAAGADYTQSGLYDINFNTRGFNNLLSRRIQTLVDGRDTAAPESSVTEWYNLGFLADDLESIEFVRGPSAALYGANSVNGVISLKTKAPRDSLGGRARLTFGELNTAMADIRWAGALGHGWFMKALANSTRSDSFTKSRVETVEYPGLPKDAVAPAADHIEANSGLARFDRYTAKGSLISTEGGFSESGGETFVTQAGRVTIRDVKRAWVRAEFAAPRWDFLTDYNDRHGDQLALAGAPLYTSSRRFRASIQGNRYLDGGRGRFVYGASYLWETIDSAGPDGKQTLYIEPLTTNEGATFGQLDYLLTDRLKFVGGLRLDASTLYDLQLSPKGAVVYRLGRDHSLRVSYNRGFQVGTYTELDLSIPAAAPLDLSALEAALAPVLGGVKLGLDFVPVYAIGNQNLTVEKIQSLEYGYTGAFGSRALVSVDFYQNYMRDFISDLLPGINPQYPAYQAPASLSPAARAAVEHVLNETLPGLTNRADGGPQIVYSNNNTGRVRSRGVETSLEYRPTTRLGVDANYAWFGFTIVDHQPGAEPQPNAPAHRASVGATYTARRSAVSFHYRWVDTFNWASGAYVGPVPSYGVADFNALVKLSPHWEIGVNVANAFDHSHYEMFGGDLLRRRAIVHPTFTW